MTPTNSFQGSLTPGTFYNLGFTGTAGRSFLITTFQSNADFITGLSFDVANTSVQDATLLLGGNGRRVFRVQTISGAPTQIRVNVSSGSQVVHLSLVEVTGLLGASPFEAATAVQDTATTSHSLAYTTSNANCFALASLAYGASQGTLTGTNGWVGLANVVNMRDGIYLADTGASGSKTLTFTTSLSAQAFAYIAVYKGIATPTVSTVTGDSVTEGAPIRFTITLSGATGADTDYPCSWGGTAVAVTDYDSNLSNATFSAGISFVGGQIRVASGYSGGTVDVTTYNNALDQADRTLILTVGGTSSTGGTITDDDAPPTVSISDATESFGTVTHTLTLSQASGKTITVQVDSANGSKTAGTHYTAITAQTVTFNPGETEKTVVVTVL